MLENMINLTSKTIDKAIINKALNIVSLYGKGFVLTNETICTYNSLMIFRALFNNRCAMLDDAFENLYYMADRVVSCANMNIDTGGGSDSGGGSDDQGGGGNNGGGSQQIIYYDVNVITNPNSAIVTINGVSTKSVSLSKNSNVRIVAKATGYYDKTYTITSLVKNENIVITFTDADKIPTSTTRTVTIGAPIPVNANIYINGTRYQTGDTIEVEEGTILNVRATAQGYEDYTDTITVNSDVTIAPVLSLGVTFYNVTIGTPVPSNAVIKVNGQVKYPGTTSSYESGTRLTITAEANGYQSYTENITVDRNMIVTPVLEAIPAETYTYKIVVSPSDATVIINNQITNEIVVNYGDTVNVEISKAGYGTQSFSKQIYNDTTDNITLVEDDNNVYIQVYGYVNTNNATQRNRVQVLMYEGNNEGVVIPNNTPYRITPGVSYGYRVTALDASNNPNPDYAPATFQFSASQTRNMTGINYKEIVCNEAFRVFDDNTNIMLEPDTDNYLILLGEPHGQNIIGPPLVYDNDVPLNVVANGYKGQYIPEWEINSKDIYLEPSDDFLIVRAFENNEGNVEPVNYDNITYNSTNPYENDFTVELHDHGHRVYGEWEARVDICLFIDSNLSWGTNVKDINNVPIDAYGHDNPVPIDITFDDPCARLTPMGEVDGHNVTGVYAFGITFDVDEQSYQQDNLGGKTVVATITDGVHTREVTFILPIIDEYEP